MDGATIYILRCADGSFYVGLTRRSAEERTSEHNNSSPDSYTARRLPVTLLYAEHHDRITDAIAAERRLKGWSRAKKIAYMRGDFDALHDMARRRERAVMHDPSCFDTGAPRPAQHEGS